MHTYGFQRTYRTIVVVMALSTATGFARLYACDFCVVERDIHCCFDEMYHAIMLEIMR